MSRWLKIGLCVVAVLAALYGLLKLADGWFADWLNLPL